MRIGLISDTHGDVEAWRKAMDIFGDIDFAIHCGDILSSGPFNPRLPSYDPLELAKAINIAPFPTIFAKGNCDAEVDVNALVFPIEAPYTHVYVGRISILATHGHLYSREQLIDMGRRYNLTLIISGHTHVRGIEPVENVKVINPGSASLPKGDDDIPSVGLIEDRTVRLISLKDGSELERAEI